MGNVPVTRPPGQVIITITPFAGTIFEQLVEIGKRGVILYDQADTVVGSASMTATWDTEPIFNITITDSTIAGIIHVDVDELTSWTLNNDALTLVAAEPGAGSVTIIISYQVDRLTFLLKIREHWVKEGVCTSPDALPALRSEVIPLELPPVTGAV